MNSTFTFNPPVIAHRGASAYAPENTMAAFIKAAQLGIKWIEFDVMQAACGKLIVFHDERLDRTTSGKGKVSDFDYEYIRTLDAGSWFNPSYGEERVPHLGEVLLFLKNNKMFANLEIKAEQNKEEQCVIRLANEFISFFAEKPPSILFSSFSVEALYFLRKHIPEASIGLLLHEWDSYWKNHCKELSCVSVHVNEEIMTQEAAQEIKSMNKLLLCYTVNDPKRALELYSFGVDAVFSDVPNLIAEYF